MNIITINSIYMNYFILSKKSKLILPTLQTTWFYKNASHLVPKLINQTEITQLPFIIKLRFIKTIKSVVPQLTYQYVTPSTRLRKSFRYPSQIRSNQIGYKNSSNIHLRLYNLILKV